MIVLNYYNYGLIYNLLKSMLRKLATTILPLSLLKNSKRTFVICQNYRVPLTMSPYRSYFSTDKHKNQNNSQHKETQKQQSKKTQNTQQNKNQKKLSELSNEQLIDLNTQQSIKIVHTNIKKMEQLKQKQEQEIKQLNQKISFFGKHHNQSATKQEQLLENIKIQEEQLQRIKKRADKQIETSKDFAITKIAKQLLQVADSIKRCKILAEQKAATQPNDEYLKKIIELNQKMKQFFKLYDIQQFDPTNKPFDPNTCEGLITIPTPPNYQKNTVATTMMTGYRIKNRLLRSAKVGIFV